ncbi:MAG: archease [Candidatus Omnitrophica bacterium]|nr:archease [Candidatus Omnitrophota bacterium]
MKDYEIIEHTADIGIRVSGRDLKDIFIKAASAMFDIIAEPCNVCDKQELKESRIKKQADDQEQLLIEWLNELLSLSEAKEIIFHKFKINKLTDNQLEAVASGFPRENYKIKTEIKAATYHELKIEKTNSGWQAEIIFDV